MKFVSPTGYYCFTVSMFGKQLFTLINVHPRFDGYSIDGKVINENDWGWVADGIRAPK
jgi:hypothetical protein